MRTRILIFNGYYTPAQKYGGPLTSIRHVVDTCSDEFEFYIVARNHDVGSKEVFGDIKPGWQDVGKAKVKYIGYSELNFDRKGIRKLIEEVRPELIWFSGILTPQIRLCTLLICKKLHIPVLLSPRGEVSADRIKLKAYKKKPYLFLTRCLGVYKDAWFHATSEDEVVGLRKFIRASDERIFTVSNIGVVPEAPRENYEKEAGKLRVVFISRIHEVKNIKLAVQAVSKVSYPVYFDVYGPLEQPEYWKECENEAIGAPANVHIKYCGQLNPDEVGEVFRQYDCFLFPTLNENYGHAIAEALANSCPVILSRGTTPWDAIDTKAGYVCDNKVEEYVGALENLAELSDTEYSKLMSNTLRFYTEQFKTDAAVDGHKSMFCKIIKSNQK